MTPLTVIMMIATLGLFWGGFTFFLVRAIGGDRKTRRLAKRQTWRNP